MKHHEGSFSYVLDGLLSADVVQKTKLLMMPKSRRFSLFGGIRDTDLVHCNMLAIINNHTTGDPSYHGMARQNDYKHDSR
jgi:hypothetical protein